MPSFSAIPSVVFEKKFLIVKEKLTDRLMPGDENSSPNPFAELKNQLTIPQNIPHTAEI